MPKWPPSLTEGIHTLDKNQWCWKSIPALGARMNEVTSEVTEATSPFVTRVLHAAKQSPPLGHALLANALSSLAFLYKSILPLFF